ncbi:MAG: bifunctional phosphoglucose/phosphomannose isomerase, partial [Nitrososphaerales archaeon]
DYEEWPKHCEEALNLRVATPDITNVKQVIYAGMGGSAASGDILKDWLTPVLDTPFTVLKDYHLPRSAGKNYLVLVVSCSGDTEEALNVAKEALKRGCSVAAVSSDGLLERVCSKNGVPFTKVKRLSVPRSSLPYLFYPSANILKETIGLGEAAGQLASSVSNVKSLYREIGVDSPIEENPAKEMAAKIFDGVPIIYASAANRGVAIRFKASLNENAKMVAHTAAIPELCHNEVEGWTERVSSIFRPVFIRHPEESSEISKRFEVVKEIVEAAGFEVYELWETGENHLGRTLRSTYLSDYVSIYAAVLRKEDPIVTLNIDTMKRRLRS